MYVNLIVKNKFIMFKQEKNQHDTTITQDLTIIKEKVRGINPGQLIKIGE